MATKNSINATNVNHTLILGTGSAYTSLANGTTGQFLGANTGADPSWQTSSGGTVVQIVTASSSSLISLTGTIPTDDSIPQSSEGTEIITASITPTNASSTLLIRFYSSGVTGGGGPVLALFVDSTADALSAGIGVCSSPLYSIYSGCIITYSLSAGSTSSRTYKMRGASNNGSAMSLNGFGGSRVFGGVASTILTIMEIAP